MAVLTLAPPVGCSPAAPRLRGFAVAIIQVGQLVERALRDTPLPTGLNVSLVDPYALGSVHSLDNGESP